MSLEQQNERELASFYDGLARYEWWQRRFSRTASGEGLEIHKRLNPTDGDGPGSGTSALHDWLWNKLQLAEDIRALDVGCGFGASLFSLARSAPAARINGLSLSRYQIGVASRESKRLGLGERAKFAVRNYNAPITESPFDLVLSIESLFHSPDLSRTIPHLANQLETGGRIALVEDMAINDSVADTEDGRELRSKWSTRNLYTNQDYHKALESCGLEVAMEFDLTEQVPARAHDVLAQSELKLKRFRRWAPTSGIRRMFDAFLGGIHLERLYDAGKMRYRVLVAGPTSG